jgi:predicted HicB family RNase H-like nuclease
MSEYYPTRGEKSSIFAVYFGEIFCYNQGMNTPTKRGRPATQNPTGARAHIDVVVHPDVRQRVRVAAAQAGVSTSEWIRRAIERELSTPQ